MSETLTQGTNTGRLTLDPNLYQPEPEEVEFFKSQTGISDEKELKNHVLAVQKEAWAVVTYRCIQSFGFMTLKMSRLPYYEDLLSLGRERQGAIFIDFACCFGNDIRKAVMDGYPVENALASDIEKPFWELGHKLFKSTPESFPVPFVQGNVFDPQHIAPRPPYYAPPSTPRPGLTSLTSLTPLQGYVSAIHVSAFFHLFGKEEQVAAAHALASLLSPEPGSMIFGVHSTLEISGLSQLASYKQTAYNFNPDDWRMLWEEEIFDKGGVKVEAAFVDKSKERWRGGGIVPGSGGGKRRSVVWCVKRV